MSKGQSLFVPLGGGLDTGIDDKLLPVGKVPTLSNCFIDRSGEVVKRGGLSPLNQISTPGGNPVNQAWQLATYKSALVELSLTPSAFGGQSPLYFYSGVTGHWSETIDPTVKSDAPIKSGVAARASHSLIPVANQTFAVGAGTALNPDVAYSSGYYFTVHAGPILEVTDATTNRVVYTWNLVGTGLNSGEGARVIVTNGYLVVLYIDDSLHQLNALVWLISSGFDASTGAPTFFVVAVGLSSGSPDRFFDVINAPGVSTFCSIAYRTSIATTRRADFTPSTGGVADVEVKTAAAVSIPTTQALAWIKDLAGGGRLGLITCTAAALTVQWNLPAGSGTPAATYVLDAAPGPNVRAVAGHTTGVNSAGNFNVIYEVYVIGAAPDLRVINFAERSLSGVLRSAVWVRSIGMSSSTFAYQGVFWAVFNYESRLGSQSSYFLVNIPTSVATATPAVPAVPQARIALWNSAGNAAFQSRSHLSNVAIVGAKKFSVAIGTSTNGATMTSPTNPGATLQIAALTFDGILGPAREAADSLYVTGSMPTAFGGRSYEEDGFSIYPEQPTLSPVAGGSMTRGAAYRYQIVYSFVDENGRKHRSTPSVPVDIQLYTVPFPAIPPVFLATTIPLPACTVVGSGPGKYLIETAASGTGLTVDGVRVLQGSFVLVQNQAAAKDNGVYIMTNDGQPPSAWQLTRSPFYDGSTTGPVNAGSIISVRSDSTAANGVVNRGKQFALQGAGPFTVDTTALTFVAVTDSQTVSLSIPTLRLTNRTVTVEVYRTQANTLNGLLTLVGTVANDTTVDTLSFSDTFSDAAIVANETLYISGGVLPSEPSPGFSYVFVAKNRLWGLSMDNPGEAWFTDEFIPGEAPRWNEERIVPVLDEHGSLTAGAPLDDKVILFKGDAIYAFTGDGPSGVGQGGFTDVQLVSAGVGATNQQSIAVTKDGVFFGSSSTNVKIKMLDRSLSIEDIGAPVRSFDPIPIIASGFIPVLDQIRFYLGIKTALVYDTVEKQWSTFSFTDSAGSYVHGVPWNGTFATATSTPTVLTEDQSGSVWADSGNVYPMSVWSPWVQLSGIKGFSRLKKIQGVGVNRAIGVASLDVVLFIDFASAVAGHYSGKPGVTWNWEMIPRTQRGGALQVQLTEASATAGFKVSGVTMLIGTKQGLTRQAASTRLVGQ